jgi:predicted amidohydrolase
MIVNERGRIVADAHENAVASADLDLTLAADKRMTLLADTFADRRPEFYGTLTEPTA